MSENSNAINYAPVFNGFVGQPKCNTEDPFTYKIFGDYCYVYFKNWVKGVSNDTIFTFTLPIEAAERTFISGYRACNYGYNNLIGLILIIEHSNIATVLLVNPMQKFLPYDIKGIELPELRYKIK